VQIESDGLSERVRMCSTTEGSQGVGCVRRVAAMRGGSVMGGGAITPPRRLVTDVGPSVTRWIEGIALPGKVIKWIHSVTGKGSEGARWIEG